MIMMNKRRTSLMAAVLVGTTMLLTPVQAGIPEDCMNGIGKVFKGARMTAEAGFFLVGTTIVGAAWHFDSPEKIIQALRNLWIGTKNQKDLFPVELIFPRELEDIIEWEKEKKITTERAAELIKKLGKEAKEILENNMQFLIHCRTPLIIAAGGVATIALMLFVRNLIKNDNKSKTHDQKA